MNKLIIILLSCLTVACASAPPPPPPVVPDNIKVQIDPKLLEECADAVEMVSGNDLSEVTFANLQILGECKKKNRSLIILLKKTLNN